MEITLEQLKTKQEGLNSLLEIHLNDLTNMIYRIVGTPSITESGVVENNKLVIQNGLLEEIDFAQRQLETKIDSLNYLKQTLGNAIFAKESVEAVIQAR